MLATYATGFATTPLIASCSFVFRVVGFIIDEFFLKKIVVPFSSGINVTKRLDLRSSLALLQYSNLA